MFKLLPGDMQKIDHWLKTEVYPEIVAEQKRDFQTARLLYTDEDGNTVPYLGANGGALTFSFTPTGIGVVKQVSSFGKTLDLTNYDEW